MTGQVKRKASGGAASSGGAAVAPPVGPVLQSSESKRTRDMTVQQLADKKIVESLKGVTPQQTDVLLDPATNLTMRQRLERDIASRRRGGY